MRLQSPRASHRAGLSAPALGSRQARAMRRLLPLPAPKEADLDAVYWVKDPDRQHIRGVMVASTDGAAAQAGGRAGGLPGSADTRFFALLRAHADVLLAGANTARAEGYGGYRPSGQQRAWRRARGLAEVPPIAVVTRRCALDPAGPLFTGNPNPPAGDHLRGRTGPSGPTR